MSFFRGRSGEQQQTNNNNSNSNSNNQARGGNPRSESQYTSAPSETASSMVSSIFSGDSNAAPSTLGGATSVTGGADTQGKKGDYGLGTGLNDLNESATLDGIANEMIDGNGSARGNRSNTVNTMYEDARESNTPVNNERADHGSGNNSSNNGAHGNSGSQSNTASHNKTDNQNSNQNSNQGGQQNNNGNSRSGDTLSPSNNDNGNNSRDQHRSSTISQGTTGDNKGAGYANVSSFEQTDAASFVGKDPIAQAGDFARDDAEIIFLSSEMGSGANRQPMTRFKLHEVNLNVHSPVLSEMIDDLSDDQEELQLEEDAATLKLLFGLMYNRPAPSLGMNEWQVVLRLARCAQKYDVSRAKEVAAAYFTEQEQLGALSPFMTYAFAVQYKLPALEESAAERSVRYDIHRLPELVFNMMGFTAFQQLAAFHTRRQSHYSDALNNIVMDPKELADQCYQTGGVCVIAPWNKLKQKLAWPKKVGKDGSKRPPEPADVIRKLVTEIGQIDCGTCSKALVEGALQAQLALESMPSYADTEDAF